MELEPYPSPWPAQLNKSRMDTTEIPSPTSDLSQAMKSGAYPLLPNPIPLPFFPRGGSLTVYLTLLHAEMVFSNREKHLVLVSHTATLAT